MSSISIRRPVAIADPLAWTRSRSKTPTDRLVLAWLLLHSADPGADGVAWCVVRPTAIAHDTGVSEERVRRSLTWLVHLEELQPVDLYQDVASYTVVIA